MALMRSGIRLSAQPTDAAALASVAGDVADAQRLAGVHGATVVAWTRGPGTDEVTVTVRLNGVTAVARASKQP